MSRKDTQRQVDAIRSRSSELENHLIDEYSSGYISRREFVRRGTVIGMSIPVVGFLAAACGTGRRRAPAAAAAPTPPSRPAARRSRSSRAAR